MSCRCKRATPEAHLCHGGGYTCPNPAQRRFYNFRAAALAGQQLKFDATDTYACDECWAAFQAQLAAAAAPAAAAKPNEEKADE